MRCIILPNNNVDTSSREEPGSTPSLKFRPGETTVSSRRDTTQARVKTQGSLHLRPSGGGWRDRRLPPPRPLIRGSGAGTFPVES